MTTPTGQSVCTICGTAGFQRLALQKNGIQVVRCPDCGVGRAMVKNFDPSLVYTDAYFQGECEGAYVDYLGSESVLRREFASQVRALDRRIATRGKVLEIGCAYGFFLQEATQHGFQAFGVEMARAAVDYCHASGLTAIEQGPLTRDYLERHGPFDAIVMLDVIEHVDDVAGMINMAAAYVRRGGVALITTGDWGSLFARLTGASWRHVAPPLHLWYFTRASLERLFARAGFELSHLSHPWKVVPLSLAMSQAATMIGLKLPQLPQTFSRIGLPANLFDSMQLLFHKT